MTRPHPSLLPGGLGGLLLLALCACHGSSSSTSSPEPAPSFSLTVTPAALSLPAGGGGYATVTVARTGGFGETIALALEGAPAGVLGSGSVPTGAQTAQLALLVGREVAPQTLEALKVKGSAGSQSQSASFRLVIAAPLPIGQVRPDLVQASGGVQRAGTLENAGMASEPVRAGTARDAGGLLEVRHGFLPSGKAQ